MIISNISWKGGTGKTTLTVAAMVTLALQGKRVLGIDLDSNLSLTRIFGKTGLNNTSINLLNSEEINPVFTKIENVDLIPSDLRISRMTNISDNVLRNALRKMLPRLAYQYDYIFIDPPGTMNSLTRNSMKAADKVIIPSMPSDIDFEATGLVMNEMEEMELEADVSIVLNGWDNKRNLEGIKSLFTDTYPEFFYEPPVSSMKSLRNLTARVNTYRLSGLAKQIIDNYVQGVIL